MPIERKKAVPDDVKPRYYDVSDPSRMKLVTEQTNLFGEAVKIEKPIKNTNSNLKILKNETPPNLKAPPTVNRQPTLRYLKVGAIRDDNPPEWFKNGGSRVNIHMGAEKRRHGAGNGQKPVISKYDAERFKTWEWVFSVFDEGKRENGVTEAELTRFMEEKFKISPMDALNRVFEATYDGYLYCTNYPAVARNHIYKFNFEAKQ